MPVIYISGPIDPTVLEQLETTADLRLGFGSNAVDYLDVSHEIDAVLQRGGIFDREKIEVSPRLKIIARHGVGTDNVDVDVATEHGIWVTNTPGSNSRAVAEHVFALTLALARGVVTTSRATRAGNWASARDQVRGFELAGRTLGLIGFGNIARKVNGLALGFGMNTRVFDPYATVEDIESADARPGTMEEVVSGSDVLSLHIPLTEGTRHLIGAKELLLMKPHALVINTARGGVVDEAALADALQNGVIGGAALDVLESEAIDMQEPLAHSLLAERKLDNLILTPHIGGQTPEALATASRIAMTCIEQSLAGEVPQHAVNTVTPVSRPKQGSTL